MSDDATSTPEGAKYAPASVAPKLTDEQRQYVVSRLAAHEGPTRIARDMRERFGVTISRQGIANYDPTRQLRCAQAWAERFGAARGSAVTARSDKSVRIARIERLILGAIEIFADRIFKGADAEGRKRFGKRPEDVTDNDRIRALVAFVRMLRATDPAGYAEIRSAFSEESGSHAAGGASPSAAANLPVARDGAGEAPYAG
jgi:hypothetical protein